MRGAVRAVEGVAQARELQFRTGAPGREPLPDAQEAGGQRPARVLRVRGPAPLQQGDRRLGPIRHGLPPVDLSHYTKNPGGIDGRGICAGIFNVSCAR